MEYAKDEIFKVRYTTKLNRLKMKEESWTSQLCQKIKKHKLLTTTMLTFFMFAIINMAMIYGFMKILQSM